MNILQELAGIRRRGWGYDNEEDFGVRCIAVPVFNTQGKVIAALSAGIRRYVPDPR